jgi:hypothetical protein
VLPLDGRVPALGNPQGLTKWQRKCPMIFVVWHLHD